MTGKTYINIKATIATPTPTWLVQELSEQGFLF